MGVLRRQFRARALTGATVAVGKIDSGASRTVLTSVTACRLGFDVNAATTSTATVPGGAPIVGFDLPVRITIGRRSAIVRALVPIGYAQPSGSVRVGRFGNLIGADFLQKSGARLDYGRPDAEVLGRVDLHVEPPFRRLRGKELRQFRAWLKAHPICRRR